MGEPYRVTMIKDFKLEFLDFDKKAGATFTASHGLAQMLADAGVATIESMLDLDGEDVDNDGGFGLGED